MTDRADLNKETLAKLAELEALSDDEVTMMATAFELYDVGTATERAAVGLAMGARGMIPGIDAVVVQRHIATARIEGE